MFVCTCIMFFILEKVLSSACTQRLSLEKSFEVLKQCFECRLKVRLHDSKGKKLCSRMAPVSFISLDYCYAHKVFLL